MLGVGLAEDLRRMACCFFSISARVSWITRSMACASSGAVSGAMGEAGSRSRAGGGGGPGGLRDCRAHAEAPAAEKEEQRQARRHEHEGMQKRMRATGLRKAASDHARKATKASEIEPPRTGWWGW
jgi:hypothetical protein